tara:strand:- start:1826 stop:2443 length:618 start_codon:yes stop_codon:yes gene_type:complete
MFKYTAVTPPVTGWLEATLEQPVIDHLWKMVNNAKVSVKDTLAGNITESLNLQDENDYFLENVLVKLANNYINKFPFSQRKPDTIAPRSHLKLEGFWVNYQKKHEFNPIHDHAGLYSFVVWMKIPTKSKEQHNLPFLKGMEFPCASNFEITYIDTCGHIKGYPYFMDPEKEGKMLFFPASLKHSVYPFYESDDNRVSISGNLFFA